MKLFEYEDENGINIKFSEEALMIAPFRDIIRTSWKRSKKYTISGDSDGRDKELAYRELAFIHFMSVYNTKFIIYEHDERIKKVIEFVGLPNDWEPDELILEACSYYADAQITPSYDMYLTARKSIKIIKEYLEDYNPNKRTNGNTGALLIKPKEFIDTISSLDQAATNLNKLEKIIREEQENSKKGRGGRRIKKFELKRG